MELANIQNSRKGDFMVHQLAREGGGCMAKQNMYNLWVNTLTKMHDTKDRRVAFTLYIEF